MDDRDLIERLVQRIVIRLNAIEIYLIKAIEEPRAVEEQQNRTISRLETPRDPNSSCIGRAGRLQQSRAFSTSRRTVRQ